MVILTLNNTNIEDKDNKDNESKSSNCYQLEPSAEGTTFLFLSILKDYFDPAVEELFFWSNVK